jgi:DNA (cytosine-5)-methyltransferase 1
VRRIILDLFAGPGGWSHALTVLGARDIGLEWDTWACKTRARAGQLTIQTDVARYPAWIFSGRVLGLIASPPCQAWSMAGKRLGLVDQPLVHQGSCSPPAPTRAPCSRPNPCATCTPCTR